MKKLFSILAICGVTLLISCGPSEEEKQAAEKNRQDSLNAIAAQRAADSTAAAMSAKATQDSMMMIAAQRSADSVAAASKKPAPKAKTPKATTQEKKAEDAKKVTGGRGH